MLYVYRFVSKLFYIFCFNYSSNSYRMEGISMNVYDRNSICAIIGNQFNYDPEKITAGMNLKEEFMLDSLDRIQIVMDLENEFEFGVIPDEKSYEWKTVGDIFVYVENMLLAKEERCGCYGFDI